MARRLTRQDLFDAMVKMERIALPCRFDKTSQLHRIEATIRSIMMEDGSGNSFILDCLTRAGNIITVYANTKHDRYTLIKG